MPAHETMQAERWEGGTPAEWQARWGVPDLRIFRSIDSTNDVARTLAEQGAPDRTVVLADEQRRGRGRRGRGWVGDPGQSLLLSMVLRPVASADVSVLPLRVGLAVGQAIEDLAGLEVGIKWPNDLVVDGRKLGGILCEGVTEGEHGGFVVAGIGLNVLQRDDDWPPDLLGHATSIAAHTDRPITRAGLAGRVVEVVSIAARPGGATLRADEREALARRDVLRGRIVTVDGRTAGKAAGVDADGALVVERDGALHRIIGGTIRAVDADDERVDET